MPIFLQTRRKASPYGLKYSNDKKGTNKGSLMTIKLVCSLSLLSIPINWVYQPYDDKGILGLDGDKG